MSGAVADAAETADIASGATGSKGKKAKQADRMKLGIGRSMARGRKRAVEPKGQEKEGRVADPPATRLLSLYYDIKYMSPCAMFLFFHYTNECIWL